MNQLEIARKLDTEENLVKAAEAYELGLSNSEASLEDYLNCALVYFQMNDFGTAAHLHLPPGAEALAYNRANELLDQAEHKFGNNAEIDFWRLYFPFLALDEKLTVKQIEKIAACDSSLTSFMFLYGQEGYENPKEIIELNKRVSDRSTARKRFIWTMLDSCRNLQAIDGMKYLVK